MMPTAHAEALVLLERSLTIVEESSASATRKLDQLVELCVGISASVKQIRDHTFQEIDKHGVRLRDHGAAIFDHESRLHRIEIAMQERANGR